MWEGGGRIRGQGVRLDNVEWDNNKDADGEGERRTWRVKLRSPRTPEPKISLEDDDHNTDQATPLNA
jgi:hypothetical protein